MIGFKKFLSIALAIAGVGGLAIATDIAVERYVVGPANTQVYLLDDDGDVAQAGGLSVGAAILPWPRTIAQINALTSGTTGQVVVCSDCVFTKICVSSGTVSPGAWTLTQSTAVTAGIALPHCS